MNKSQYIRLGLCIIGIIIISFLLGRKAAPQQVVTITETAAPQIIEVAVTEAPIQIIEEERIEVSTANEALAQIDIATLKKDKAVEILNNMAFLEVEDERTTEWAQEIIRIANSDIEYYTDLYETLYEEEKWAARAEEYPTATYIWLFLKEQGFNDYVAAGILGNIMTEAGGQTLDINPSATNGSYYGICQWGPTFGGRYTDLDGQLELLMSTIKNEIDTYCSISYEEFLALEDVRQASLYFAQGYERPGSAYYSVRQNNAETAYEYFTS